MYSDQYHSRTKHLLSECADIAERLWRLPSPPQYKLPSHSYITVCICKFTTHKNRSICIIASFLKFSESINEINCSYSSLNSLSVLLKLMVTLFFRIHFKVLLSGRSRSIPHNQRTWIVVCNSREGQNDFLFIFEWSKKASLHNIRILSREDKTNNKCTWFLPKYPKLSTYVSWFSIFSLIITCSSFPTSFESLSSNFPSSAQTLSNLLHKLDYFIKNFFILFVPSEGANDEPPTD